VVSHADPHIALVALLLKDAAATRIWIREVLGPLADAGEQNRIARETLATYYAQGENAVRTAEALGLHRNTVRQRIAKLENDRAGFRGDALQIALALRVYDDFDPIDPTQGGG
jgi:DNA-binding PucR family transcriptional regulator